MYIITETCQYLYVRQGISLDDEHSPKTPATPLQTILLLLLTASASVLTWRIPNFSMRFLLKVAGESKSRDGPVSSTSKIVVFHSENSCIY